MQFYRVTGGSAVTKGQYFHGGQGHLSHCKSTFVSSVLGLGRSLFLQAELGLAPYGTAALCHKNVLSGVHAAATVDTMSHTVLKQMY